MFFLNKIKSIRVNWPFFRFKPVPTTSITCSIQQSDKIGDTMIFDSTGSTRWFDIKKMREIEIAFTTNVYIKKWNKMTSTMKSE
jgi:hypothetical protein